MAPLSSGAVSASLATGATSQVASVAALGAAATATTTSFSLMAGVAAASLGAIVIGAGLAAGAVYSARDEVMRLGDGSATVGDVWSGWAYDAETAISTAFSNAAANVRTAWGSITDDVGRALGVINADTASWGQAITKTIADIVAAAHNGAAHAAEPVDSPSWNGFLATLGFSSGGYRPATAEEIAAYRGKPQTGADVMLKAAAEEQARRRALAGDDPTDRVNHETFNNAASVVTPATLAPGQSIIGAGNAPRGGHHRSQAEIDHDKFVSLAEQVSPQDRSLEQYAAGLKTIATEAKAGTTSVDELARVRDGLTQRMTDYLKFVDPQIKAN
jgi:hypothetical protein